MNYCLCLFAVVVLTISCERTGQQSTTAVTPAALLTKDSHFWSTTTASSTVFDSMYLNLYHTKMQQDGCGILFIRFKPGGFYERLEYREDDGTATWISMKGLVEFNTTKAGTSFTLRPTHGVYRHIKNGTAYSREIPLEDLCLEYSTTFLWKTGTIPGSGGARSLRMVNISKSPAASLANPDPACLAVFHEEGAQ
ncbi:MAG: hypothetical protein QM731_09320 [Chitinophagaceae bacterium]